MHIQGCTQEHCEYLPLLWQHAVMYEGLYGLSACTENVEYSLHMPDDIVRHSTLDNYWCYLYMPHTHPLANRCAVLCFTRVLARKLRGATSTSATNVSVVSPQIANYHA